MLSFLHCITWSELQQSPLDPARPGTNVLEGLPVVLAHLKVVAHAHPHPDPEPVADEDVEEDVVPPALVKVGQEVPERHLSQLPHHRDAPADAVVPEESNP